MHHATLVKLLSPLIAGKWRPIGRALKLKEDVLQSIATKPANKTSVDRFSDMITQWLSRDATEHPKPTLSKLCMVLFDDSVGEESLGTMLQSTMKNMQG